MVESPNPIVLTPGFAGGRLRTFNLLLRAQKDCASTPPVLVLDENLFAAEDLRFPVQNTQGDVVFLEVPDHGKLSHGSRAAFRNALEDSLPATAEVEKAIDDLLPPALATPLESAKALWKRVFPNLGIETIRRGAPSPPKTEGNPDITWASARHFRTIQELGLELSWLFEGEQRCIKELVPVPAGELGQATERLREVIAEQLAVVKKYSSEVDPNLIGAWARLRRSLREDVDKFSTRADRCARGRSGIQSTRLHSLAQAIRPHGQAQETMLSLMSAVAAFQLPYQDLPRCLTSLLSCGGPEMLLRTN